MEQKGNQVSTSDSFNNNNNSTMYPTMNIFQTADSIGSFKTDFLEIFCSGASVSGNDYKHSNNEENMYSRQQNAKDEARSRSSSLGAEAEDVIFDPISLPFEAASLANAGMMADALSKQCKGEQVHATNSAQAQSLDMSSLEMFPEYETERREEYVQIHHSPDNVNREEITPNEKVGIKATGHDKIEGQDLLKIDDIDLFRLEKENISRRTRKYRSKKRKTPPVDDGDNEFVPEDDDEETPNRETKKRKRKVYEPEIRIYFEYKPEDVLCQRGGLSNCHPGNCRFREEKEKLQSEYFATPKLQRTKVSEKLVKVVHDWGGRFLRQDSHGWYEVHHHVARTKAGQALRETYTPEQRAHKRDKYNKKKKSQQ